MRISKNDAPPNGVSITNGCIKYFIFTTRSFHSLEAPRPQRDYIFHLPGDPASECGVDFCKGKSSVRLGGRVLPEGLSFFS